MTAFKTHGKWILSGEHSVLRGYPAVVFPIKSKFMITEYSMLVPEFRIKSDCKDTENIFNKIVQIIKINYQNHFLPKDFYDSLKYEWTIKSNLIVGAGMGASAVISVTLAKILNHFHVLPQEKMFSFAKSIEDLFHGESSGVDVAVALTGTPLLFDRNGKRDIFNPIWTPNWRLSYSGSKGYTQECIKKVKSLEEQDPNLLKKIDIQMAEATRLAIESLTQNKSLSDLVKAIDLANKCFFEWGLISPELDQHMSELKKMGALAVKPTGSGLGGFALSLWKSAEVPRANQSFELIEC